MVFIRTSSRFPLPHVLRDSLGLSGARNDQTIEMATISCALTLAPAWGLVRRAGAEKCPINPDTRRRVSPHRGGPGRCDKQSLSGRSQFDRYRIVIALLRKLTV